MLIQLKSVLLAALLNTSIVQANNSNNNNNNNPNYYSLSASFYSEDCETQPPQNDSQTNNSKREQQQEQVVQFLNGYGNNRPSSQTSTPTSSNSILFQGPSSLSGGAFVAMAECAFVPCDPSDEHYDFDEDEDEDDDDNDGSSSMLSNASLSRSRVSAGGSTVGDGYSGGNGGKASMVENTYSNGGRIATPTVLRNKLNMNMNMNTNMSSNLKRKQQQIQTSNDPLSLLKIRGGALAETAATTATTATAASLTLSDEFLKRLIVASFVTLLYEGSLGHILEFLKIAMQTAPLGTTYLSILSSITSQKGLFGLWDGFIPWGVVQAIAKGGVFGLAHAVAKSKILPLVEAGIIPEQVGLTLAGGIAGGFQGYVLSPTLLLKTRVMTNDVFREKMSLWRTTLLSFAIGFDVVKDEGLGALMKGSNIFAIKRVFDWSTRYFFSDVFEAMMMSSGGVEVLSPGQKVAASLLGGTASTMVTLPLDVIVAKSQDAKKAGVSVSAWDTFMKDYREGGWKGLYDANMMGFEARLAHVCFTTVAMKTGTGIAYDFLFGNSGK